MALIIVRIVFIAAAAGAAVSMINSDRSAAQPWLTFLGIMGFSTLVIVGDVLWRRKEINVISSVYIGLLVGVLLTYVLSLALTPMLTNAASPEVGNSVRVLLGVVLCYSCISMLMQTKDDFRFIIPYVEFSKEIKGVKPYLLDTSVVIDGRIADLLETNLFDSQLIMPRFVLNELQGVADSGDKMKRARGRRGLDVLNRLRNMAGVDLKIYDGEFPELAGQPVDMKLVLLAKHLEGKIVTGDFNLNKVAKIHGVPVINLNDISNALKPVFLPGEGLEVRLVKAGEEIGQGVGYLDDGTMIVVEGGRDFVGKAVRISVTSVLQTSAGRMIFGKYAGALQESRA